MTGEEGGVMKEFCDVMMKALRVSYLNQYWKPWQSTIQKILPGK
jgi:hypothetical protein